jgi:hypothetical protein
MLVDRASGARLHAAMSARQPRNAGTRTSVELYEIAGEMTL